MDVSRLPRRVDSLVGVGRYFSYTRTVHGSGREASVGPQISLLLWPDEGDSSSLPGSAAMMSDSWGAERSVPACDILRRCRSPGKPSKSTEQHLAPGAGGLVAGGVCSDRMQSKTEAASVAPERSPDKTMHVPQQPCGWMRSGAAEDSTQEAPYWCPGTRPPGGRCRQNMRCFSPCLPPPPPPPRGLLCEVRHGGPASPAGGGAPPRSWASTVWGARMSQAIRPHSRNRWCSSLSLPYSRVASSMRVACGRTPHRVSGRFVSDERCKRLGRHAWSGDRKRTEVGRRPSHGF